MKKLIPGIVLRVSHLLVIQVFFIFGALALMLFGTDTHLNSGLGYSILLLFLTSILIALLGIYLIRQRFHDPFRHLVHGMEKTARGELCSLVDKINDRELDGLGVAFNHMSKALSDERHKLTSANRYLVETSHALWRSRSFLATVIDANPSSIITVDRDFRIVLANQSACQTFGFIENDLIGRTAVDLISSADSMFEEFTNKPESVTSMEKICKRADGESFPALVVASPIRRSDGVITAFLLMIRDISESRGFQEMMIRLDRYYTRGEMAGEIAHEMNNYLAIILGNLELLPLIVERGEMEKADSKIELMKQTIDRIVHFTHGLLDSPQDEICFDKISANQVVENVVAFLKPQNKFDLIDVRVDLHPALALVEADSGQLQQLLVNMIYNAAESISSTMRDDRRILVKTEEIELDGEPYARISIRDNGPGVVSGKQELLFVNRFTTKPHGHGIGLITCKRIADAHGARVWYFFDEGAVFGVDLPLRPKERKILAKEPALQEH